MSRGAPLALLALVLVAWLALVAARPVGSLQPGVAGPVSRGGLAASAGHRTASVQQQRARIGSKLGEYYHSTRQLYDEIKRIGESCAHLTIGWERAPTSVDGGKKSLMTVRINFKPDEFPSKPERALFFFGEHARELISPEVGLEFIRRACDPKLLQQRFLNVDATLQEILQTTEFLIFPNANPSGRRVTERGAYCNRVNDRQVDLNRNWGEHWSSKSNHPDTYPGQKAWSEAETVILAHAASTFSPTIFISIHSGSLHMLSPFAFKSSLAGEPAASTSAIDPPHMRIKPAAADNLGGTGLAPVLATLKHVNRDFCRCQVGAAGHLLGYLSPGTCLDFIYNRVGTRYSFALEIYSGKRYAGPKRRGRRASAFLQEQMTETTLAEMGEDAEAEMEMDESTDAAADGDAAEFDQQLMEVKAAERADAQSHESLAALPSFDLPSFAETASQHSVTSLPNDGDVPEQSAVLFPATRRGKARSCLYGFNPVTKNMYDRTVDHWSRGLLAFVHSIRASRPKAQAVAVAAPAAKVEADVEDESE